MKLAYLLYIISGSFKKLNETKLIQKIEDRSQIKSRIEASLNQRNHIKSRITIKSNQGTEQNKEPN
jgi:hypothetical protein